MTRKRHGKAVDNGVCLYTSPSALTTADPNAFGGCFRRWWYRYVLGIKEPATEAQKRGTRIHKELETYLLTGEQALGAIAMSAWPFVPRLSILGRDTGRYEVEANITPADCFEIAGVPVVGFIDLINATGAYIDPMGAVQESEVIEVLDWKTTSNIDYAKTGRDLIDTNQMAIYGMYVARREAADRVRLSHVNMQTKGKKRSSKSTCIATLDELQARWPAIESVCRSIQDIAGEDDINKVPANFDSCGAYGGCGYADSCPRSAQQTAENIFGKVITMNLLNPEVSAEIKALEAEEKASKITHDVGFAAALAYVQVQGYGRPRLSGAAAVIHAQCIGAIPEQEYPGEGQAVNVNVTDRSVMIALANEVSQSCEAKFVEPPEVLPGDAPASSPTLAADPVEGYAVITEGEPVEIIKPTPSVSILDKCIAAVSSGKWGPLKKPDIAQAFTELLAQKPAVNQIVEVTPSANATRLFVDCITSEGVDLAPFVRDAADAICKQYGAVDLRVAPKDSPLSYGGWKGALAAYLRESYPSTLEPGDYTLDTRGSEIHEVAAEALADIVAARGIR